MPTGKNLHEDHRERVREEFRVNGLSHFPPHKMLEMLLFYSIPRGDTNEIGHLLIDRFDSISSVFDAPYETLCEIDGIGPKSAVFIKFIAEIARVYMNDDISKHADLSEAQYAKEFMRHKFMGKRTECIYIACLAVNGKLLHSAQIAEGSPETVQVSPIEIAKTVLRANAVKVVMAHNHPNGICNPSARDFMTTNTLYNELKRVDIELSDHIIVAADGIYSMKEKGMFPR